MNILITGGAGFVGSNLAIHLSAFHNIVCLDNLKRRGSEYNLNRLKEKGIQFVHGDVRNPEDLVFPASFDVIIECSAEPSVMAGYQSPRQVLDINLLGAINCLELAKEHGSSFIFVSTSRVYPVKPLQALDLTEQKTRFELSSTQKIAGVSALGVSEEFPLKGHRTIYGASKLAAELLIEEYRDLYALRTVVNRCGVIAGPWQMGKVDQGVFTWWMLAHYFDLPISYIGYGGTGKQVRDLLHIDDLCDLIALQLSDMSRVDGKTYNVGGGTGVSLSLMETTELCRQITGRTIPISEQSEERLGDVPLYITDISLIEKELPWKPARDARTILSDIYEWIKKNEELVKKALLS